MNTRNDIIDKVKFAAQEGDINLLYTLIEEDPYVLEYIDLIPFVETPLHIAASMGHLQFATEIMRLKPSFALKLNQQGFSPIHLAMQNNKNSIVIRFVDMNNEVVRIKGREGLTPLHIACQNGEVELLANFLFVCPNSVEDVTVRGENALHIAVKYKQFEALDLLVGWLKTNRQRDAIEFEKSTLNCMDEMGNTILHISALDNYSKALPLLVNTKITLNAKNLENSTALDIASSAEIKGILLSAGAKHSSKLKNAPKLEAKLRSKVTFMEKIIVYVLRIRKDISDEQRNAFLIVAALIATTTYQSSLSPPAGFYQGNAWDHNNNLNNTSLNSNATTTSQEYVGKSVITEVEFYQFSFWNTLSLLLSTMTICLLTPSGVVGGLLMSPMVWFTICYINNMGLISPTPATIIFNLVIGNLYNGLGLFVSLSFCVVYKRFKVNEKNKEIKIRNRIGGRNKW